MATSSAAANRRHARQDCNNAGFPPLRPQPPSPTLTNPDMILPDYDNSEPIPAFSLVHGRMQPLSLGWLDSDQTLDYSDNMDDSASYPLNTPIIYGNGTMLSDIGEVTEVESNVGGPSRRVSARSTLSHGSNYSSHDVGPHFSSPMAATKQYIRRASNSSARDSRTSGESINMTPKNPQSTFSDLDDSVSVDDSNFQGDDEESLASSFFQDPVMPPQLVSKASASDISLNEDRYSTMSISKRAEQILANAKRRLTTMEGNLTRARTFSYSSVSDGSTPSPVRLVTPKQLQKAMHWRNASQNGLPTTPTQTTYPQRSASALGAAGGYREPLPLSPSADAITHMHGISQHPLDLALEPLSEDGSVQDSEDRSDSTPIASYTSPTFNGYGEGGTTRSVSAAQMRGIQDQMNGLKGKIFSLREQAAADSMKRRSLQSLRQQSLFTNARVDDANSTSATAHTPEQQSPVTDSPLNPEPSKKEEGGRSPVSVHVQTSPPRPRTDRDMVVARHSPMQNLHQAYLQDENSPPKGKTEAANEEFDRFEGMGHSTEDDDVHTEDDDVHTANGDAEKEAISESVDAPDHASESGDSLYHETHQHPISHEDREDAFDYEHFFLHSAMGHLSRQGYNSGDDESASESSEESVATTRAAPTTNRTVSGMTRRPSLDTITSVETFATAIEGRVSRNSMNDDHDGCESPVIGVKQMQPQSDKRPVSGVQESGSSSEDSGSWKNRSDHQRSFSQGPVAMMGGAVGYGKRAGLHRPSVSSFESVGTNRSFPLVNKVRPGSGTTPGTSPDQMMRLLRSPGQSRRSSLNEQLLMGVGSRGCCYCNMSGVNGQTNGSAKDGSHSGSVNGQDSITLPSSMQPLKGDDQVSVDQLLAGIQKCALGLRDMSASGMKMHDTYRRRLEAARQILDGDPDSF